MNIRKAGANDLSRIAEIYIFNNRVNFFPIFQDEGFSFGELQVVPLADNYFGRDGIMENLYVFEDGVVKGFLRGLLKRIPELFLFIEATAFS